MRATTPSLLLATLVALGCSGCSSSSTAPPAPVARTYLYVANGGDNTISQFIVGSDGALSPNSPATVSAGVFPAKLLADPQGRYLFAKNSNDGTMSAYTISAHGTLTPNGSLGGLGGGGYAAIHPGGGFVYVTTYGATIQQLVVNANGTLSANTPASVTAAGSTTGMALSPAGNYAYACAFGGNLVNQLSVDASGRLALLEPGSVPVADNPRQVAVTPDGSYVYVVSSSGNAVSLFVVGADGKLAPNTPATVALADPGALAVSHNGQWLYVSLDAAIAQFVINGDGTLSPNSPATISATSPSNIVTDPDDRLLYYTNFVGNSVGQLAIATDGTLSAIAGASATVASGSLTWGIALVRR